METMEVGTGLAGLVSALVLGWASLVGVVQVLLLLMALDIATGMAAAFAQQRLNSAVGWRGVSRKAVTLGVVTAAVVVEPVLGGAPVASVVAGFYVAVEALSILENAGRADVPVPGLLRQALTRLQAQAEEPGQLGGRHTAVGGNEDPGLPTAYRRQPTGQGRQV
jgi:toxin secretion/phage lysis holin